MGGAGSRTVGSPFMTSTNATSVLLGVRHLQAINTSSAIEIYASYIFARSAHAGLSARGHEGFALSRLICLNRILDRQGLKPLLDAWLNLTLDDKFILIDHFTGDGTDKFAVVLRFLPLFLSKATENPVVGLAGAL